MEVAAGENRNPVIPKEETGFKEMVGFSGPCSCKGWNYSDMSLTPKDRILLPQVPHCLPAGSLICGST